MVLRIDNLTFGYAADQPVVRALSGTLEPGRLCALIGPNAAGKSTLLRLMLGHLDPWQGAVCLGDQPVHALQPAQRARWMSYVPQRAAASFAFTVEQVVEMGRFALGPDQQAVDEALEACDLLEHRRKIFAHLSAGQQQRVLLARAICQSHGGGRVMLLDEPTSAMDLRHVHHVMGLLVRQVHERGLSVVIVLHDLNLAARYADEVWLMDEGRRVADGPWDQVLRPEVLEPVYRVQLRSVADDEHGRPVFAIRLS